MFFHRSGGGISWLLVGLGNPGNQYTATRHNMGFMALDRLADREGFRFNKLRFRAWTGQWKVGQDAQTTADVTAAIVNLMKDYRVGSVLKHFPGYGNNADTHTGIAVDSLTLGAVDLQDVAGHRSGDNFACGDSRGSGRSGSGSRGSGGSGSRSRSCGGSSGLISLVLVDEHGLAFFDLDLVGFAVECDLVFHIR